MFCKIIWINEFFSSIKRPFKLLNQARSAHYIVNSDGQKVIVSKRVNIRSKREKWQKVVPMEKEEQLKIINSIEKNHRLHSDPDQARLTSQIKFDHLLNYLQNSSSCRSLKSYQPPENTNEIIDNICKEFFGDKIFDSITFSNLLEKFKFLTRCYQEFGIEINNSELHLIKSIKDVRNYYLTPIKGKSKYDEMSYKSVPLPPNLHVIPEPIRFNPKTDTFFDGLNAFPGSTSQVVGLKAKKKYPTFEDNFVWPDI